MPFRAATYINGRVRVMDVPATNPAAYITIWQSINRAVDIVARVVAHLKALTNGTERHILLEGEVVVGEGFVVCHGAPCVSCGTPCTSPRGCRGQRWQLDSPCRCGSSRPRPRYRRRGSSGRRRPG